MPKLLLTIDAIEREPDNDRRDRQFATAERYSDGTGVAIATKRDSSIVEQCIIYTGTPEELPAWIIERCYPLGRNDRAEGTHSTLAQGGYSTQRVPVTHSDHSTAEIYITFQWLTDGLQPIRNGSTSTGINARI